MDNQFIKNTAEQLVEAGDYATVEEATEAFTTSLSANTEAVKEERKKKIKTMNRRQRRLANRKADRMLKKLQNFNNLKPSEQFKQLPEEKQKELLLNILAKVHQQNLEYEEKNNNGKDSD